MDCFFIQVFTSLCHNPAPEYVGSDYKLAHKRFNQKCWSHPLYATRIVLFDMHGKHIEDISFT